MNNLTETIEKTKTTASVKEHPDIITDYNSMVPNGAESNIAMDLSALFFEIPTNGQDGVFRPLLVGVSNLLRSCGVQNADIRAAAMAHIALCSAKMGYPLTLQLVNEDPSLAVKLMDHSVCLAPANATVEVQSLKLQELLLGSKNLFNGKCLVCPDPEGFKKVSSEIDQLLTRGHTSRQEIVRRNYDVTIEGHKAAWPISFVGVATGKSMNEFFHPAVLRLPLSGSSNDGLKTLQRFEEPGQLGLEFEIARIRKTFERLQHRKVMIPYLEKLHDHLVAVGCEHIDSKLAIIAKTISICSIINNPPPVDQLEIGSALYGVSAKQLSRWLRKSGLQGPANDSNWKPLVATRLDYYLAWLLLDSVIAVGSNILTERQILIFETIKRINLGRLTSSIPKKNDDIEKLATIASYSGPWIKREKLFEEVNRNSSEFISLSTLNNELMTLIDKGLIGRDKPPKSKHYSYYVHTFKIDSTIALPNPGDIEDTVSEKRPMKVLNPFTGKIQEI